MPGTNTFKIAETMYKILKAKGVISLEDILMQFEVSTSTAYNIQRALKAICENHPNECEVKQEGRRTIFVYKESEEQAQDEEKEIERILNAKQEPG